jgi:hypothetical protein
MVPAVNFYDEPTGGHQEIDHVLAEHHLTPHRSAELSSAEHFPESLFGAGGRGAHLGGALGEDLLAAKLCVGASGHGSSEARRGPPLGTSKGRGRASRPRAQAL